jgi:hypothetical protein
MPKEFFSRLLEEAGRQRMPPILVSFQYRVKDRSDEKGLVGRQWL